MTERTKAYRGLRRADGDTRVEVIEVVRGTREERDPSVSLILIPWEELVPGSERELRHPAGPHEGYDWPGTSGGAGWRHLAEALLFDAAGPGACDAHAEEYAAERVGELPSWSVPAVDEAWSLVVGAREFFESVFGSGRRRAAGEMPVEAGREEEEPPVPPGFPPVRSLEASNPEEARRLVHEEVLESYHEDWRFHESEVRGWAEDRATVHAEAREAMRRGEGLLLVDLYGPLSRRFGEMSAEADRAADVVSLGVGADAFNLLECPSGISPEDLAALVAGTAGAAYRWPDALDLDHADEEEREEGMTLSLFEDSVLTLVAANEALAARGMPARYGLSDLRGLLGAEEGLFSAVLPLIEGVESFSEEDLPGLWDGWRRLPREVREERSRPIREVLEEIRSEGWMTRAFATPGRPLDLGAALEDEKKIVLADLRGDEGGRSRSAEFFRACLLRLFSEGRSKETPTTGTRAFANGARRRALGGSGFGESPLYLLELGLTDDGVRVC